jgi:hypothetical protein
MQTVGNCNVIGRDKDSESSLDVENPMRTFVRFALNGEENKPWSFLEVNCPVNYWYEAPVAGVNWSPGTFPRTLAWIIHDFTGKKRKGALKD